MSDKLDEHFPDGTDPELDRQTWALWAEQETDSYYRHAFWLRSLTPAQRRARWFRVNGPVLTLAISMFLLACGLVAIGLTY